MLNNSIIIEKLRQVKEGLFTEITNKIEEIEKISTNFYHTNLKVHDISHYLYKAMDEGLINHEQQISTFEDITRFEYEAFKEWEAENLSHLYRNYIGRTSSFYFDTKWNGEQIDNDLISDTLEGKSVLLNNIFGNLDYRVHDYLFNKLDLENALMDFEDEAEFDSFLEDEVYILECIKDDLETVEEIVLQAKLAYGWLSEYKTEQNEYALAKDYLSHDIIEYYSNDTAQKLFDRILNEVEYLNQVHKLEFSYSEINEYYVLHVELNDTTFNIDTVIKTTHELSFTTMNAVDFSLQELIKNNFKF